MPGGYNPTGDVLERGVGGYVSDTPTAFVIFDSAHGAAAFDSDDRCVFGNSSGGAADVRIGTSRPVGKNRLRLQKNHEDEQSDVVGPTKGQKSAAVWSVVISHVTALQLFHRLPRFCRGVVSRASLSSRERAGSPLLDCTAGITAVRGLGRDGTGPLYGRMSF